MLSLNLVTKNERKEEAKIQLRRIREEERKKRIFNPRTRLIGVDRFALQEQIEENNRKLEEEEKINEHFIRHLRKADLIAVALEEKERQERIRVEQEINKFRKNHQRAEHRREFDLNDPDFVKKQLPARINDDDPRLGPSSAQRFHGEDLSDQERLAIQKEQMKSCLEQQMKEKEMAEGQRRMAEEAYKNAVLARDKRAMELSEMERDCRRKLQLATQRFNKALSEERSAQSARREKQMLQDNFTEIYNAMASDLLTENPNIAQSNLGPFRKIPYLYKGMSDDEKAAYRRSQLEQIEEKKMQREEEKKLEKQFYDYFDKMHETVADIDNERETEKKKIAKSLEKENLKLAKKQHDYKQYTNRYGLTNVPSEEYFQQFNQSSR